MIYFQWVQNLGTRRYNVSPSQITGVHYLGTITDTRRARADLSVSLAAVLPSALPSERIAGLDDFLCLPLPSSVIERVRAFGGLAIHPVTLDERERLVCGLSDASIAVDAAVCACTSSSCSKFERYVMYIIRSENMRMLHRALRILSGHIKL